MNCKEFQSRLEQKKEEHSLSAEAVRHLTQCPGCHRLYRELDQVWNLLDTWKGIEPTPEFRQRFWIAARQTAPVKNSLAWIHPDAWFGSWRPALASSVILCLLMAGSFLAVRYGWQQSPSNASISQNLKDDLLLERLDRTYPNLETTEYLDAFDAWNVSGEETPSLNPSEDASPPSDFLKNNTYFKQEGGRA